MVSFVHAFVSNMNPFPRRCKVEFVHPQFQNPRMRPKQNCNNKWAPKLKQNISWFFYFVNWFVEWNKREPKPKLIWTSLLFAPFYRGLMSLKKEWVERWSFDKWFPCQRGEEAKQRSCAPRFLNQIWRNRVTFFVSMTLPFFNEGGFYEQNVSLMFSVFQRLQMFF